MLIKNDKKSAVKSSKWSNPGAAFYDKLHNEDNSKSLLDEAYLITGEIDKDTSYSASGCKYPHHSIKNGILVLNERGVRAAYTRAKQMGVYYGKLKEHLDRHLNELGVFDEEKRMKENFEFIESFINKGLGTNLHEDIDLIYEASHEKLKYDFRFAYDTSTGHLLKIIYSLDNIQVDYAGHAYNPEDSKRIISDNIEANKEVENNITKKGNVDHKSHGQKVLKIIDIVTNQQLNSAKTVSAIASGSAWSNGYNEISKDEIQKRIDSGVGNVTAVKVGEIDNIPSFKSTGLFGNLNRSYDAQMSIKAGRGAKIKDFKTNYINNGLQIPVFNNPSNKEGKDYMVSWISNYVSFNKDEPDAVDDVVRVIKLWNSDDFNDSPEFEAAKKKKFDTVILYNAANNLENSGKTKEVKIIKDAISKLTKQNIRESVNDETLIDYSGFIPEGYNAQFMSFGNNTNEDNIDYLLESKDATLADLSFQKKESLNYQIMETWKNGEVLKYIPKNWNYLNKKGEIAIVDDELAGFIFVNKDGFIGPLKVEPEFRGHGLSEVLLQDAIDKFGGNSLGVYADNEVAYNMYRKFGFVEYDKREYSDGDIAIMMRLKKDDDEKDDLIEKKWFITSDDGVDNCCIKVKGYDKPMRGRSSMITLRKNGNEWEVMCKQHETGDYGVPGGGWNKNEDLKSAAIRELQEETLSNVKDVKRMGTLIEYREEVQQWVKDHVKNPDDWWYGYYSAIFVGIYDGKFTGHVDEEDRESGYGWVKVEDMKGKFPEEYSKAIDDYISAHNRRFKESLEWIERFVHDDVFRENAFFEEVSIETPYQLLDWMKPFKYGWITRGGKVHNGSENIPNDFFNNFHLQSPVQLASTKVGVCWDFVELEREWFTRNDYKFAIFYIILNDSRVQPTHTFLVFSQGNHHYWFEYSWEKYRGIHRYGSVDVMIKDIIMRHRQEYNDYSSPVSIHWLQDTPKYGITCQQYMRYAAKQPELNYDQLPSRLFRERANMYEEGLQYYVESSNDDLLPVYAVATSASLEKTRNNGDPKSKDELDSINTRKMLNVISKGDNYNHILLSFNDDLTEMYSFNNHGIVKESINDPTRWESTEAITISVMFFHKEDWEKMHNTCVDWLKNHKSETTYAYSDLLKLFYGKPVKKEKRFLCSSFAGYILSLSDRKNLNKDYSRVRPEDVTLLPRSFFVMTVKDRNEFKEKKQEFDFKVHRILEDHREEINDYNNDLPKLMLQSEMGKLKTFDKICEWLFSKFCSAPDTVTESSELIEEKSHGTLKYCYRIGVDITNGNEVAVQFILDKDKITNVSDGGTDDKIQSHPEYIDKAVELLKKTVTKYGHIDFITDGLKVDSIFYRNGGSINSVKLVPLMNNNISHLISNTINGRDVSADEFINSNEFRNAFLDMIKKNEISDDRIEVYKVGSICGQNAYKTTKLLWGPELLFSYKFTPAIRGFNNPGRTSGLYSNEGLNKDMDDVKEYYKSHMNNKFKEANEFTVDEYIDLYRSMITEDYKNESTGNTYTVTCFGKSITEKFPAFYSSEKAYMDKVLNPEYDYSSQIHLVSEGGEINIDDISHHVVDWCNNYFHKEFASLTDSIQHYMDLGYRIFTESKDDYVNYLIRRDFNVGGNSNNDLVHIYKLKYDNGNSYYSLTEQADTFLFGINPYNTEPQDMHCELSAVFISRKDLNLLQRVGMNESYIDDIQPKLNELNSYPISEYSDGFFLERMHKNSHDDLEKVYKLLENNVDELKGYTAFTEAEDIPPEMPEETSEEENIDEPPAIEEPESGEDNVEQQDDTPPEMPEGEEQVEEEDPLKLDVPTDTPKEEPKKESLPKQTDRAESNKNGVRRKKLYIAFIEWAKTFNNKNSFGSIFDKDAFKVTYPFVPEAMRYFYRLANPLMCVLSGDLTFFQVGELRKVNADNSKMNELLIFAGTPDNNLRVFNTKDGKVYKASEENRELVLGNVLGDTFDTYLQNMIDQGDILNAPLDETPDDEGGESNGND